MLTALEICAGAGGQAVGLENAGYEHVALVENDPHACETLRRNRSTWKVVEEDVNLFDAKPFEGVDLLSGGVPCPPFSIAGKRLGADDDRDLFPALLRLVEECHPRAIMIENVKGLLQRRFDDYRQEIISRLAGLGYEVAGWRVLNASDFGVPQLRPRSMLVALEPEASARFTWPEPKDAPPTVGEALRDEMASGGWKGANAWAKKAAGVAPTLVGGSKKHGGPDLGPTRAKDAWRKLGVNAHLLAEEPPPPGFSGAPHLTVRMAARIQGFPPEWEFVGRKTAAYRQVGNAFPPPVAEAVGRAIADALRGATGEPGAAPLGA